jgi:hypothetical protein
VLREAFPRSFLSRSHSAAYASIHDVGVGTTAMIITVPAAAIISDTFKLPSFGSAHHRRRGRTHDRLSAFTSKAYAEAGVLTAYQRGCGDANCASAVTTTQRSKTNR